MQQILASLKKDGFINISYPGNVRSAVEETANAWKDFCDLPIEAKQAFPYNEKIEGGYEFKGEVALGKDLKENFHITPKSISELKILGGSNSVAQSLIDASEKLFSNLAPFTNDVLEKLEEESGVTGLTERTNRMKDSWVLRFLHYLPGMPAGHEIASTHPDKGSITLHLYESADGLEYFWNDKWMSMPVGVDYTASIGGMGLQYATQCEVKATNHRVVATEETSKNGRYSMVMFLQIAEVPNYDKEKNGRLQDVLLSRGLGFNYNMTFDEFKTLFKS